MSQRAKVVITDFLGEPLDQERTILGDLAEVTALNAVSEDDLVGRIEDADAVMMYHFLRISRKTIDRLQRCKLIVRCGAGVDNVDHAFAATRGIPVANVPDYGTEEVADSAIGLALALARGFHQLNSRLRAGRGEWSYTLAAPVMRLRGRVFGIVGIGRIGTAAALRAKALGMDVAFYDPYAPEGRDKSLGVRRVESLDELLAQSHVLSFHCPLTPETKHMLNRGNISRLPKGSFVVNTARGAVVDPLAVLDALTANHLVGVALDVLETEPPDENDSLLKAWRDPNHPVHDRLILNPHAAFYCEEGLLDMRVKGSQNVRRALLGQSLRNVVNGL